MVTRENEQALNEIMNDAASKIPLGHLGRVKRIKWIRRGTLRKVTDIMLNKTDKDYEDTITTKLAAAYLINSYWGIKLFWWLKWRLMWDRYSDEELKAVIEECKKKVQLKQYFEIMMSQIGLRDTLQQMTREEVEVTLRELQSARKDS